VAFSLNLCIDSSNQSTVQHLDHLGTPKSGKSSGVPNLNPASTVHYEFFYRNQQKLSKLVTRARAFNTAHAWNQSRVIVYLSIAIACINHVIEEQNRAWMRDVDFLKIYHGCTMDIP
jgi:hypothetical protein